MQYYDKKAVGIRIKQIRKSKNLTQVEMSESLDYTSERQLQRIENGETACSVDKLMEIAQLLGISTDYLLFGDMGKKDLLKSTFERKTAKQKLYLEKVIGVIVENLELLAYSNFPHKKWVLHLDKSIL